MASVLSNDLIKTIRSSSLGIYKTTMNTENVLIEFYQVVNIRSKMKHLPESHTRNKLISRSAVSLMF